MIYLVGSYHAARMWGIDENVDTTPSAGVVQVIVSLKRARGHRPLLGDRIVMLPDADLDAYNYLGHALELARVRRETSLRQAP